MSDYDFGAYLPSFEDPEFDSFMASQNVIKYDGTGTAGTNGVKIGDRISDASRLPTPGLTNPSSERSTTSPPPQLPGTPQDGGMADGATGSTAGSLGLFTNSSAFDHSQSFSDYDAMQASAAKQPGVGEVDLGQLGDPRLRSITSRFWDHKAQLLSNTTGATYSGSYAELYEYPEIRMQVIELFGQWQNSVLQKLGAGGAAQASLIQARSQSGRNGSFGSTRLRNDATVYHRSSPTFDSSPSLAMNGTTMPSPLDLDSQQATTAPSPQQLPLLQPLSEQKGVRYEAACKECKGDVIMNGKGGMVINGNDADGIRCTRCFRRAEKDVENLQFHTQTTGMDQQVPAHSHGPMARSVQLPGAQTMYYGDAGTHDGAEVGASMNAYAAHTSHDTTAANFVLEHDSVAAARAYVARPPADVCEDVNKPGDNWQAMRNQTKFTDTCAELYNALTHPRSQVRPNHFSDTEWAYYDGNHWKTEQGVHREVEKDEQRTMVKARVMLAVDDIISVHEHGVPKYLMQRSQAKTHRGYQPEVDLTCEARIRAVINYAQHNKYVASDIIHGRNIGDLARSPNKYVARKLDNARTNQARSTDLRSVKDIKKGKKTTAEVFQEGPRKRGRKPQKPKKPSTTTSGGRATKKRGHDDMDDDDDYDDGPDAKQARSGGHEYDGFNLGD